jgi:hypothetical protein
MADGTAVAGNPVPRVGFWYDENSATTFGEQHVVALTSALVAHENRVLQNSGMDPAKYRFENGSVARLPVTVGKTCDLNVLAKQISENRIIQVAAAKAGIDVIVALVQCREVNGFGGVAIVPSSLVEFSFPRTGVIVAVTGAVYYDADPDASNEVFAHEMGHVFGGMHPDGRGNDGSPMRTQFPWMREQIFATVTDGMPDCGALGVPDCHRLPLYANPRIGTGVKGSHDVVRGLVAFWPLVSNLHNVRARQYLPRHEGRP